MLKRRLLLFYGSPMMVRHRPLRVVLPFLLWYSRRIYCRLAGEAADQIQDYQRSGFAVLGIGGMGASPSCGVHQHLRICSALERLPQLDKPTVSGVEMKAIIRDTVNPGRGLYMELLPDEFDKRGVGVAMTANDLVSEGDG